MVDEAGEATAQGAAPVDGETAEGADPAAVARLEEEVTVAAMAEAAALALQLQERAGTISKRHPRVSTLGAEVPADRLASAPPRRVRPRLRFPRRPLRVLRAPLRLRLRWRLLTLSRGTWAG